MADDTELLNIIQETFPELAVRDFAVLGHGKFATACLVNNDIVFKVSNPDKKSAKDAQNENYILPKLAGRVSFDIPRVVYPGRENAGRFLFGETRAPGTTYSRELHNSFDADTRGNIMQQIGRMARELHSVNVTDSDGAIYVEKYTDVIDTFHKYFTEKVQKCFSDADCDRIRAWCDRYQKLATEHPVDNVLIHADLHYGNMMFDAARGRITGLIDFGASHFAPAQCDMAYYYGDQIRNFLAGYGDNGDAYLPDRQRFHSLVDFLGCIDADLAPERNIQKVLDTL